MKNTDKNKIIIIGTLAILISLLFSGLLLKRFLDTYKTETAVSMAEESLLQETNEQEGEKQKEETKQETKETDKDKESVKQEITEHLEDEDDDVYRMLDFDRRYILNIGVQEDDLCSLSDLAYARAILDQSFDVDPFEYFDGDGADWRKAGFEDIALSDPLETVLQRAYDQISQGKPVLFYVDDIYGHSAQNEDSLRNAYAGHYVLLIGYQKDAEYDDLEASDFYAADPSAGYCCAIDSYMPWIILSDDAPAKVSGEYALYAPVSDQGVKTCLAYQDTCNWDADQSKVILPDYAESE